MTRGAAERGDSPDGGQPPSGGSFAEWMLTRQVVPTVEEHRVTGSAPASLFRVRLTDVFSDPATTDLTLQIGTAGYCDLRGEMGHGRYAARALAGDFAVTPPYYATEAEGGGRFEMLILAFPWSSQKERIAEASGCEVSDLGRLHAGIQRDSTVERLVHALWQEAETGGPLGTLFADSLLTALTAHLLRLSEQPIGELRPDARLTRSELRRALAYIHDNLAEDLSLGALATAAGCSPFHLHRLFREATGQSPHQYVIRTRVEQARWLLTGTRRTVAQVAEAVGFSDQTLLARHCRRLLGVTPTELRSGGR